MASSVSLDVVFRGRHTKDTMASDMEAFPITRPERIAVVQVGFAPSSALSEGLQSLLKPAAKSREILFRSEGSLRLSYGDSDNNGPLYGRQDSELLARDQRKLRALGERAIAVSDIDIGMSVRGDVQVRLELHPTIDQRKLLGGFVLGDLVARSDEPVMAYVRFPHSAVVSDARIKQSAAWLTRLIKVHEMHESQKQVARQFYLHKPYLTQRTGDLRVVR